MGETRRVFKMPLLTIIVWKKYIFSILNIKGRGRPARGRGRGSKSLACVHKAPYSSSDDDDEVVRQAVKAIRLANQAIGKGRQKACPPVHFVRRSTRQHSMYTKPPVLLPEDIDHSEGESLDNADIDLGPRKRSSRGRKPADNPRKRLRNEPVNKKSQKKDSAELNAKEKVSPAAKKSRRRQ